MPKARLQPGPTRQGRPRGAAGCRAQRSARKFEGSPRPAAARLGRTLSVLLEGELLGVGLFLDDEYRVSIGVGADDAVLHVADDAAAALDDQVQGEPDLVHGPAEAELLAAPF